MSVFLIIVAYFFHKISVNKDDLDQRFAGIRETTHFKGVIWSMGAALVLIYIRTIFKVVDTAAGFGSKVIHTEIPFCVFDGGFCILAVLLLSVFYPGFSFKKTKYVIQIEKEVVSNEKDH
ncbi:unnamed protein product [Ambrosiozyma monospora]|uniref:Unnamed protein product n=1 Tax=Ambrosiozyma monospora TaxID=43982 RepID=A0ACB5U9Q8_AMBMO|nr:unnamed protein product [Ambrosiozyma monospora]